MGDRVGPSPPRVNELFSQKIIFWQLNKLTSDSGFDLGIDIREVKFVLISRLFQPQSKFGPWQVTPKGHLFEVR